MKAKEYYLKEKDTKGTPRLILFILAECSNAEGYCHPAVATIADRALKSVSAVQRAIKKLEIVGKVGRKIHDGKNTKYGNTNGYYLNDFRVAVGLNPVLTFLNSKTPPRRIQEANGVAFKPQNAVQNATQTNTYNQNILTNTNTVVQKPVIDEVATQHQFDCEGQQQGQQQSARDIDLKPTAIPAIPPQSEERSSDQNQKKFLREKDLVFPTDLHSQEDRSAATNMLIKANIKQSQWQEIFDEFEGKTIWKHKRGELLANKLGYFYSIVEKAKRGEFNPESGKWVAQARAKELAKKQSLQNKTAELANRGIKSTKENTPVPVHKPTPTEEKVIKIINETHTRSELQKIFPKISQNGVSSDLIMKTWSKRFQEIRA